ncbi:hypothetical protein J5N97_015995 [Dioscorea zingiberensis]|uniref:Ribosomal protein L7/L12 C-terminal domain-containing protein n=1 Tax=Dioscorea zingiberensis TaxID=325984 RepID=A0A9D5CJ61_9LILI|nr:hypothetical protein J5N97_015995 [Dioscorea zingiberensis]
MTMRYSLRLLRLARRKPIPLDHLPGVLQKSTPWRFSSSAYESTSAPHQPSQRVSAIVDEISGLTLLEVADLTEVLRKRLGVGEMPFMAVMAPGTGVGGCGAGQGGAMPLRRRTFTDLGLKEAKELVEKAPTVLKTGVPKEEAEKIAEKMKELGAKVVLE